MKKTYILLSLMMVVLLSSCGNELADKSQNNSGVTIVTPDTNESGNQELTGSIVVEAINPNAPALAGKTLVFDVEAVSITKKGSGSTLEDTIEVGDSVEVHYTGTLENGEKFDSSHDRGETLPFTVGIGQMIPGFDAGVVGMKIGESKVMTLAPEDAYGPATFTQEIEASEFQTFVDAGLELKVGTKLPMVGGEITIIEIKK